MATKIPPTGGKGKGKGRKGILGKLAGLIPKAPKTPTAHAPSPASTADASIKATIQRMFASNQPGKGRVVAGSDRPGSIRLPSYTRQMGAELRSSMKSGYEPPKLSPGKPVERVKNAQQLRQRALARSPLALETLRRRLTGDRLGSPAVTNEDVRRVGHLFGLGEALKVDAGKSSADMAQKTRESLEGEVGFIKRAILGAQQAGQRLFGTLSSKMEAVFDRLTKDALQRGLKGLGIETTSTAPSEVISAAGFERATPRQGRTMVAVSSSNVASVGWEPHDQSGESSRSKMTMDLGTLYIQFRNGYLYRYVDCPRWVYEGLLRASSKGRFVWAVLRRGLYPDGVPYGNASVEGYERIK